MRSRDCFDTVQSDSEDRPMRFALSAVTVKTFRLLPENARADQIDEKARRSAPLCRIHVEVK